MHYKVGSERLEAEDKHKIEVERKFKLDQEVMFGGNKVTVWDISLRYDLYDLAFPSGRVVFGISEHEIKPV